MLERLNFCYLKKEFKKRFSLLATKKAVPAQMEHLRGAQAAFELARAGYIVLASMNSSSRRRLAFWDASLH